MTARWLFAPLVALGLLVGVSYCGPATPPPVPPVVVVPYPEPDAAAPVKFPLTGFVDLHAHPLSSLGFAGKLIYGGVDSAGALLPVDPDCKHDVRSTSVEQALGHDESTHGSWGVDLDPFDLFNGNFGGHNLCGDLIRQQVISAVQNMLGANNPGSDASGAPNFPDWPKSNDVTHLAMYVDWIQRAHDHGLNVMVALAVNNETLADAVAGPGDGPDDDRSSADLQIAEIRGLAERHSDWMAIADSSEHLAQIVSAGKLAVVLGLEVDNIGNFNRAKNPTIDDVKAEVARLYADGVRYLFPVHLIDNPFGTTAAYEDLFNLSNLREAGHFWNLQCASAADNIEYRYKLGNPLKQTVDLDPPDLLTAELAGLMVAKVGMLGDTFDSPTIPTCPEPIGMVNSPGLTPLGKAAIQEMMRQGMMIDVDHMSQWSVNDSLEIAEAQKYPVNSGHNTVRRPSPSSSERSLTAAQYVRIGKLHGMAGVGGAGVDDARWLALYQDIAASLGTTDGIGFGTDASGMSPLMTAPSDGKRRFDYTSAFPKSTTASASWDYNDAGVAHYGLIADFLHGMPALDGGAAVVANLQHGAQYFYETWKLVEAYRAAQGATSPAVPATPPCTGGMVYRHACGACMLARARCLTLPKRVCPTGTQADAWDMCAKQGTTPITPTPPKLAPIGSTPLDATLVQGAYTLVLATGGASKKERDAFAVSVTATGRRITLQSRTGKAVANGPKAEGGFHKNRFRMRVKSGDQIVVLRALEATPGKLDEVRGGFVAHAAGKKGVAGVFVMKLTSQLAKPLTGVRPYEEIGTFLAGLHVP